MKEVVGWEAGKWKRTFGKTFPECHVPQDEKKGVELLFRGGGGNKKVCLQVWSNHSALFGALHVCMSTASSQSLHSTAQHHLNLHSHFVICFTLMVS